MTDLKISVDDKKEEKPIEQEIKETLKAADKYAKLKEENDRLEQELLRQQDLLSKVAVGGRAYAGQAPPAEKTEKEKADEEAKKILSEIR